MWLMFYTPKTNLLCPNVPIVVILFNQTKINLLCSIMPIVVNKNKPIVP